MKYFLAKIIIDIKKNMDISSLNRSKDFILKGIISDIKGFYIKKGKVKPEITDQVNDTINQSVQVISSDYQKKIKELKEEAFFKKKLIDSDRSTI
jgi:hypothetical protein